MNNRWSEEKSSQFIAKYSERWGECLALRAYASRLIGAEKSLVLHGGGNTSVKGTLTNVLGRSVPAIFVKASGHDLAAIEPEGHVGMDLEYLQPLKDLPDLSDEAMVNELRTHLFDAGAATPSIEALMHAFLPPPYIDHTHADAILALTNNAKGEEIVRDALGEDVIILDYVKPGFALAKAALSAYEAAPASTGMVLMKHGLVTWGDTARQSYARTIDLVSNAEAYLDRKATKPIAPKTTTPNDVAAKRYVKVAPILRGLLAVPADEPDRPFRRCILRPLITDDVLRFVDSQEGKELALTPSLTSDHLIRTKAFPLWIDNPPFDNVDELRGRISKAIEKYARDYDRYVDRHASRMSATVERLDSMPRIILMPGLGVVCVGKDVEEAGIVRDIAEQTIAVKAKVAAGLGKYEGLSDAHLFDMEYFSLQHAKLERGAPLMERTVALVTGAAGAIGTGICEALLKQGCHVAVSDLPGDHLTSLVQDLKIAYHGRVFAVPLDVTDAESVAGGFDRVVRGWGGVDLVVANAGLAHVSSLADMDADAFRKLERVNVEGTLLILSEAARRFEVQGTGGDIVLVSTKNVFAPGARFGAYSATKAGAHQLARVASLELADMGVRVNMVAPDAVFSHGARKSGLWAEVGPDRMRARGLDEQGMEAYYQNRNLLKARVTAEHVAKAVLFFATRQTPTTGVTLPVDGGLPDATPR